MKYKEKIDRLWQEFVDEVQYISLDGTLQLKILAIDFANFVIEKLEKGGYISKER